MKVLAISGSIRSISSTAAVLRAAAKLAAPRLQLEMYDGLGKLPHFGPDLDSAPWPPAVAALRARVGDVGGLVIATPEYAHGMPGSLKNALDWLVSAVEPIGKPTLLISLSPSGAAHAHAQFLEVLRTMSLSVIDGGAHVFSRAKLGARGEVVDPDILDALSRGLDTLASML